MQELIEEVKRISGNMARLGWAESNGGNISVRLKPEFYPYFDDCQPKSEWLNLSLSLPEIGGERFLVTGTGCHLRNIEISPQKNLGVIELDKKGESYRLLWGYEPQGAPTSELPSHLMSHCRMKIKSNNQMFAFIHTHPTHIIALSYAVANLNTRTLTKLLWQSHAECIVAFPEGVEFLPWMMAGSMDMAKATADAMGRRNLAVWQYHGICSGGCDLDEAFGRIEVVEKAAEIYLCVRAVGGFQQTLSEEQLLAIALNFNCPVDQSLFD